MKTMLGRGVSAANTPFATNVSTATINKPNLRCHIAIPSEQNCFLRIKLTPASDVLGSDSVFGSERQFDQAVSLGSAHPAASPTEALRHSTRHQAVNSLVPSNPEE